MEKMGYLGNYSSNLDGILIKNQFLIFYYIQKSTLLNKSALEVCFLAKKGRSIAFFVFFSFFSQGPPC
jgi:hypothetical protein